MPVRSRTRSKRLREARAALAPSQLKDQRSAAQMRELAARLYAKFSEVPPGGEPGRLSTQAKQYLEIALMLGIKALSRSKESLESLTPQVWSKLFYPTLVESLPFSDSISKKYKKEIKKLGSTVTITPFKVSKKGALAVQKVHKISFLKMSEGYKLCTKRLANQKREEFSYRWAAVTCKDCLHQKPKRR